MQIDDKVWFDSKRKFSGICAEVAAPKPELQNTLLLAHFPATLSTLEKYLQAAAIEFRQYSTTDDWSLCSIDGRVVIGLATSLQADRSQPGNPLLRKLQIIVVEHHPIFARDNYVIAVGERLHCQPEVGFHIALDDPLMMLFGGEKLVALMKRIGADESESISHPFVTNAIRNAQHKIEKKVPRDLQAESIEDWVRYNLREGWN
jgi:hypothetical protein